MSYVFTSTEKTFYYLISITKVRKKLANRQVVKSITENQFWICNEIEFLDTKKKEQRVGSLRFAMQIQFKSYQRINAVYSTAPTNTTTNSGN